jgi:PPM family protein phosphatase
MTQPEAISVHVEAFGMSDIGLARENNEDFFVADFDANFFVLTDGMGGHNAGEIAAEEAAIVVCEKIKDTLEVLPTPIIDDIILHLKGCIHHANHHVWSRAQSHPSLHGMGTTLCCLLLHETTLIFAHVGDSRVYRYRHGLIQLTKDHAYKPKKNLKSPQPFPKKKLRQNVVTRSIGTTPKVEPEIGWEEVQLDDIYFLCSDGLSDYVPENIIEDTLKNETNLQDSCEKLITIAKTLGGRDNITILMIKIVEKCF